MPSMRNVDTAGVIGVADVQPATSSHFLKSGKLNKGNSMKRSSFLCSVVSRLAFVTLLFSSSAIAETVTSKASPELERVLRKNMELLSLKLSNPTIQSAVRDANQSNEKLSNDQIQELDRRWIESKGINEFIKPYLINPCAKELLKLQESHDGFSEIFLTDNKGLNVCQTNRTSDLYQADEGWWTKTWAEGRGAQHFGDIEYDESAHTEAIAIFVPITDPQSQRIIGVAKGVLDVTELKRQM